MNGLGKDTSQNLSRVAQVVRPAAGGIRRHVSLLTSGLDRKEFLPILYAPQGFELDIHVPGLRQHPVAIHAKMNFAADVRAIQSLARLLHDQVDLVHAHGLRAALIGIPAAKRAGVPSLFTAHNLLPPLGRLQRVLLRSLGRTTGGIIAVSQAVAQTLIAAGLSGNKIHVVPNGIEITLFDAPISTANVRAHYGIPGLTPLIVGIGRLSREKGFDVLLNAFDSVNKVLPDARLLLVGAGHEDSVLKGSRPDFSASAGKQDPVIFTGYVENVVPILLAADVVAIPSREEGQGLVALEAMAARKPVVAARVGGLVETIVPDVTGLLVPSENPDALAQALFTLLQNKALSQSMGEQGRMRVEQLYTVERMIHNIETLYRSLVG